MKHPYASLLAAFIGGAVVGAALGILFAPESGAETRKKIARLLEKKGIHLSNDEMDDLMKDVNEEHEHTNTNTNQ